MLTRWEYKEVWQPSEREMNELGLRGWELVAIYRFERDNCFVFKRPL